jgi:DNA-binding transcriptional regulator GbsR (MarR family)
MSDRAFRVPPEVEDAAKQIGEFIEYWGFKNVHGRIWTHIFLSAEPLDAADLIDRLGISKALVSMSISDLLEYEVIQIAGKSPRSTITYRSNPDIVLVITNVLRKRERRMLSRVSAATRLLKTLPADCRASVKISDDRIQVLNEMVKTAESSLDTILEMGETSFRIWSMFNKIPLPRQNQSTDQSQGGGSQDPSSGS